MARGQMLWLGIYKEVNNADIRNAFICQRNGERTVILSAGAVNAARPQIICPRLLYKYNRGRASPDGNKRLAAVTGTTPNISSLRDRPVSIIKSVCRNHGRFAQSPPAMSARRALQAKYFRIGVLLHLLLIVDIGNVRIGLNDGQHHRPAWHLSVMFS